MPACRQASGRYAPVATNNRHRMTAIMAAEGRISCDAERPYLAAAIWTLATTQKKIPSSRHTKIASSRSTCMPKSFTFSAPNFSRAARDEPVIAGVKETFSIFLVDNVTQMGKP